MADVVNPIIISMIGAALLVATIHALRGVFPHEQPCVVRRQETAFQKRRRLKRQKRQRMAHRRARAQAHLVRTRRTKPCRKARYHSLEWKTDVAVAEQRRRAKMAEAYEAKVTTAKKIKDEADKAKSERAKILGQALDEIRQLNADLKELLAHQRKAEKAERTKILRESLKEIRELNADIKEVIAQERKLSLVTKKEKAERAKKVPRPILREKPAKPIRLSKEEKAERALLKARIGKEQAKLLVSKEEKAERALLKARIGQEQAEMIVLLDYKSRLRRATAIATARPVGRK